MTREEIERLATDCADKEARAKALEKTGFLGKGTVAIACLEYDWKTAKREAEEARRKLQLALEAL